jgi:hypothetical protein
MLTLLVHTLERHITSIATAPREPSGRGGSDMNAPNDLVTWASIYASAAAPVKDMCGPIAAAMARSTGRDHLLLETGCGAAELSAQLAIDRTWSRPQLGETSRPFFSQQHSPAEQIPRRGISSEHPIPRAPLVFRQLGWIR